MTEERCTFGQAISSAEKEIGIKPSMTIVESLEPFFNNLNLTLYIKNDDCAVRLIYQDSCYLKDFQGQKENAISYITQMSDVLRKYISKGVNYDRHSIHNRKKSV